jgi:hypothetical protein
VDFSSASRSIFSASGLMKVMAPPGSMDSTPHAQDVCNKSSKFNPGRPILGLPLAIR